LKRLAELCSVPCDPENVRCGTCGVVHAGDDVECPA
jgi:hypothetical protein